MRTSGAPQRLAPRVIAAAICSSMLLAACGSGGHSPPAAPAAGAGAAAAASAGTSAGSATKLVTAWPADVTSLDPPNLSTTEDHNLARNIYQELLSPKFEADSDGSLKFVGADVVPELAQSWTIGP